ncbi:hypothetical protein Tco_0777766 [Tanacetum coccineum]
MTSTNPIVTLPKIPNFASVFKFDQWVSTLESEMYELRQTNLFAEAVSSISGIVDTYLASKMKEAVDVDSTMKTIIKDQVIAQVSKIMPKIKKPIRRIHQGRYGVSVPALTKDHRRLKINTPYPEDSIRRIQDMELIQYFGRYQTWSLLQEIPNTSYPILGYALNTTYPLPLDTAYPVLCPIQRIHPNRLIRLRMTKVIKGEFEKIKDIKVEDDSLACDSPLEVFNCEVSRLSKMDDDLFTYEVEIANIPCDLRVDDDSEHEADDMGFDPVVLHLLNGDDKVELTDEEFSDNEDKIAKVFRIDTNIFDYNTPICSTFNKFNYLLKVDPDLLIKDIMGFKTYDDYKDNYGIRMYHGLMRNHGLTLKFGQNRSQSYILASLSIIKLGVHNVQHVVG